MELDESRGHILNKSSFQDRFLSLLYGSRIGRMLIRPLISPVFSELGGMLLNTRLSALAVKPFAASQGIDLTSCEKKEFDSYNDFFTRKLIEGSRPFSEAEEDFISPCDARLSVYPISADGVFSVKNTVYTAKSLLKNEKLAKRYEGGILWLYRLCVDDYHRYTYPVTGKKSSNRRIPGVFHTVNPAANDVFPIYKENTREYCVIHTEQFGTVLMMEVGAMLVGKIENHHPYCTNVKRGKEKGNFAFGGSTIIVMTQKGCTLTAEGKPQWEKGSIVPREDLLNNTIAGIETKVKQGETVGRLMK